MRSIVFVTGVVLIFQVAASLAQQSPSPANEPAHKVYVMSGCLEGGSAATSVFKLADATSVGQMPHGSVEHGSGRRNSLVRSAASLECQRAGDQS